ncbi:MAG: hypothetical protein A3F87_01700 [Omnitrophica WOR_2 bacterium RIFCSPLOWO2_12_FULL_51_24]|nr:MAG: hypothetical protein A2879_05095 [Omnitrophica WOR_2 bacterium RIFCSPHIGHO2_01_FULL_49_10]OGX32658.1 MAG: hypothetical protein A3I43_03240 [Omnitrophica WOR_2 bacterium RIFCSPLOWO2_02_FULL_50_19]OGX41924.1 MAG: hypothetical protein A3F87_01700 [Omnitrophica WOR_2 bacterium RIFCSPLOWO2_12_FULL_51_24]
MLREDKVIEKIIMKDGKLAISAKDLAGLYKVDESTVVGVIEQKENDFPADFAIKDRDGYFLTESGVAIMLSFLNSDYIAQVNIMALRIFRRIRELFSEYDNGLSAKMIELERKIDGSKDMTSKH